MLARPTSGLFVAITTRSKLIQLRFTLTRRFFASNSVAALFSHHDPLNFIDRGCARVPGRLRVILTEVADQLSQLDVSNVSEMRGCMAGVDGRHALALDQSDC